MKHHSYKAAVKGLLETSEVEIKSSISSEELDEAVKSALSDIRKEISLPGFRKGSAPEKMVREKIGEGSLLAEAAEQAINHAYGHILEAEKIDAVGHPKVTVTKLAPGNPLEFTIVTAVIPQIKDLDYKKIASAENKKKVDDIVVTDEELAKAKEKVPEATKEDLIKEKEYRAVEKKRLELIEALTKAVDVVIPAVLIEGELDRMVEQMKHDIGRMGLKFEDYLKHLKKSEDDLKKEWKVDAGNRVKLDLAMAYIAGAEKITGDKEKIEHEAKHAKEHHKGIDLDRARDYFTQVFTNQAVFEFLEKQK